MNAKGNLLGLIVVIAVVVVIIFGILLFIGFKNVGDMQIKDTYDRYPTPLNCDSNRFVGEYGNFESYADFSYESKTYRRLKFDSNWYGIIENGYGGACYFVTDFEKSRDIIENAFFSNAISKIDKSFYSDFITCPRHNAGAQQVCSITTTMSSVLGSPVVDIVAHIPEGSLKTIQNELISQGWETMPSYVGKGIKFVKIMNHPAITITIEILKTTSCAFVDPRELTVFYLANDINQTFTDAKNNIFYKDTISKILSTNAGIQSMYQLKLKNPDFFGDAFEYWANVINHEENCNALKPDDKLNNFNNDINGYNSQVEEINALFKNTLINFDTTVMNQLELEKREKAKSFPTSDKYFFTTTKAINYQFLTSNGENLRNQQLFLRAVEESKTFMHEYSNYWKDNTFFDYFFSIASLILGIVVFIIFNVAIWFERNYCWRRE